MKTKPFLLATAGSTVDGRTIDDKMLQEMASSYNPKTYGARLNIEHIRGISGDKPFRAYGDVLELSTGQVDVDFNGKTEPRLGLFGVFDVTDDAKALNDANQKVYPSIEIEPNFAGKGFAYLMGCALTDSPAAIATDRLAFNRHQPGLIVLARGSEGQPADAAALEFAGEAEGAAGEGFLKKFGSMLDGFSAKFGAAPKEDEQQAAGAAAPAAFDFAQVRPMFEDLGKTFAAAIDGLRTEFRTESDAFGVKLQAVETKFEATPASTYSARPAAAGANGNATRTDC